ncbi:MAG: RNA-binding protein [Deltaproteobacteria bacterium]|nr:RNA-binding protein [Deltaproteobacteria bacterium]
MSEKVFVGSLSWNTNDEKLQAAFAPYGEITEAKVITDRDTGRSRGFGFVTFANAESAQKAISALDGKDLDGRTIKVNKAEDKPRDRDGGGGGRFGGGRNNRW